MAITSGRALSATGRRLLATALDQTTATRIEPTIPDLLHALTVGADPLPQIVAADAERDYARAVRGLVNTLGLLCDGSLRGLFDRPSTITADPTTPAMSLDLSALDNDADDVVAAAMLCSWAWSATLADTAGDHRNTVQVQDELWRALRAAPGLVEHSDRITCPSVRRLHPRSVPALRRRVVGPLTGLPQMMGTRSCRIWALSRGNAGFGR